MAVAVLVLQPLAIERRTPRRRADQKAAGLAVTGRPGQIAYALEAEHGVKDIERYHGESAGAVGGSRRQPGREGAGLVDALLQYLALLVLLVKHDLAGIVRGIPLAHRGVNTELAEHALHAKGARLVWHDRHHTLAYALVLDQGGEHAHKGHGSGYLALATALELAGKG